MSNILGQEEESGNHGLDTTIGTEFNKSFPNSVPNQIQSLFFGIGLIFIKLTKYAICKL